MGFQEWVYFGVEVQAIGFQSFKNKRIGEVGGNYTLVIAGERQPIGGE
jgi:hypothetical protein